jgi:hypothetical protein
MASRISGLWGAGGPEIGPAGHPKLGPLVPQSRPAGTSYRDYRAGVSQWVSGVMWLNTYGERASTERLPSGRCRIHEFLLVFVFLDSFLS